MNSRAEINVMYFDFFFLHSTGPFEFHFFPEIFISTFEVTVLQYLCTFLNVDIFWILVCCVIWGLEVPWQPRIRIASFTKGDRWSKNNPSKTCRFVKRLNFFLQNIFENIVYIHLEKSECNNMSHWKIRLYYIMD